MSQLIEQVVTGYLTMLGAGTLVLLPPEVPLLGTAPGALPAILAAIPRARPTAMQGPPPLFEAFAQVAEAYPDASPTALSRLLFGRPDPAFLGCGGAPVSHRVLTALRDRGITVYEGYCLSESTSVVASNTPAGYRLGSVGQPLPHVELRIADDDELLVRSSSLFAGYAGGPDPAGCPVDSDGWLATGDLAAIDQDGFLYIRGRKKNVVTTSTGRNVAADWIAARYRELPDVVTAVVFGDGLEELVGFFVISDSVDEVELRADIGEYGAARLSEIERVRRIETVRAGDPRVRHLFTVTGRPHRDRIWRLLSNNPNR